MKNLLIGTAVGVLIGAIGVAQAVIGYPPPADGGFRLQDSAFVLGIAQGLNANFTNGIVAAGTNQATATPIGSGFQLVEIDTTAASTGVSLPFCVPGTVMIIYNNGAQTLNIYPNVTNNPLTNAQDTINNATSITLTAHTQTSPACAKAGVWGAS